MNKTTAHIIVSSIAFPLTLPLLVMGYAIVFGHTYSENQLLAALSLAVSGFLGALFGNMAISI